MKQGNTLNELLWHVTKFFFSRGILDWISDLLDRLTSSDLQDSTSRKHVS